MTIFYYKNDLPDDLKITGDIAVDTESMGLNHIRDRLCVVQLSSGDGHAHVVHFTERRYNCPNLLNLLSQQDRVKIFHFARFDLAMIRKYLHLELNNIYCTKIASRLCRTYTDYHGLKDLCVELLGIKIDKKQQTSDWGTGNDLTKEQIEYAGYDVLYLHQLRDKLDEMLIRENRTKIAKRCFKFLPTRAQLDLIGWNDFDIFIH